MDKVDCKIGKNVWVENKLASGKRKKGKKYGKVLYIYDTYAVIQFESYRECYCYQELHEVCKICQNI